MKNTFGQSLTVTLFGESHGVLMGATLDGLAPGIEVDVEEIDRYLSLRRPSGGISTKRRETDEFRLVSGVFEGKTTGAPLTILIENRDTRSGDYARELPRPSHADYPAYVKYHGYEDYRGGGHFSGRVTAPLVAAGALLLSALRQKGIVIGSHIASLHGIKDRHFSANTDELTKELYVLRERSFPVLDEEAGERMQQAILAASAEGDSLGGVLEGAVTGLPAGLGEPWFDTVEGVLSHLFFSIPAVKGVSFGAGFGYEALKGSEANDAYSLEGGRVVTETNRQGGIGGGITNGMPLLYSLAVKPTPSIALPQKSVSLSSMQEEPLLVRGRHDPAVVHRARAVLDCVCAIGLSDLLALRFGTDWLGGV